MTDAQIAVHKHARRRSIPAGIKPIVLTELMGGEAMTKPACTRASLIPYPVNAAVEATPKR